MSAFFDEPRFAMVANAELSAVLRGRAFPIERLDDVMASGLPWVPANVCISAINTIPPDNPFGPMGETTLRPDPDARLVLPRRDDRPATALYLADITHHDGSFWEGCARSQLTRAIEDLEREQGLTLKVGFEQEGYLTGLGEDLAPAFSLHGVRKFSGVAAEVQHTLATGGQRLDQFVHEYGENQFEIAAPVAAPVAACDHAVLSREAIRDAARARGGHATFAPKPDLAKVGSGVHIHFSLWDGARPVTARDGGLAGKGAAFAAGILDNLTAVLAFTAPSPNSYQRITESSWVGVFACFGIRNREAAIRLCPRKPGPDGSHPAASLEFRICDGAANPYLALAALIRAGMAGLASGLSAPKSVEQDPARIDPAEREARGIVRVPRELPPCLEAASQLAPGWFGNTFWEAYSAVRRNDLKDAADLGDAYPARLALTL